MTAATLLQRLDRVRETGPGRWVACCPAHDDRSPTLSIREIDDRVLLHCFAGCGAVEILHAIGATWADVMPPRAVEHRHRKAPPPPYKDVLLALHHEAWVCLLCADASLAGALTPSDAKRLTLAVERIDRAVRFTRAIR